MIQNILLILLAYLIGSITFGRVAGLLRGENFAHKDLPGGSGVFRQYGWKWGLAVSLLDILKGCLVAWLAVQTGDFWTLPLMGFAMVAGHSWPLYFEWRGGGGIAPSIGFFLFLALKPTLWAWAVAIGVALVYWQLVWKKNRNIIYPIPFGSPFGYSTLLYFLHKNPQEFWALLLISATILLRGYFITLNKR